jgi:hypothetical protein
MCKLNVAHDYIVLDVDTITKSHDVHLWHQCMVHVNYQWLHTMTNKHVVIDVLQPSILKHTCATCMQSKHV